MSDPDIQPDSTHQLRPLAALSFSNSYTQLAPEFYSYVEPTSVINPRYCHYHSELAVSLGIDPACFTTTLGLDIFSGNKVLRQSKPWSTVYSGHQFGVWAGQLGDGRALMLGELEHNNHSWELQLKGTGPTPYSRQGDGRAVLRSSIREYLCSEAMHALGIPTTQSLSLIASDLAVMRETLETAAVVCRVAPSFIRFGSFEHWAYSDKPHHLKALADYVIERFYPDCKLNTGENDGERYLNLLATVSSATAKLVAAWQTVGFCHGVLNTDNMSILGLTLDYGPFGFLERFDPKHVCNHSDYMGRYAYDQQPGVVYWNVCCLAQALSPLIQDLSAIEHILKKFPENFKQAIMARWRAKLGLCSEQRDDEALVQRVLNLMQENGCDFTLFFRSLSQLNLQQDIPEDLLSGSANSQKIQDFFSDLKMRWQLDDQLTPEYSPKQRYDDMNQVNPKYILRNHLAEQAISSARDHNDYSSLNKLFSVLQNPYDEQVENAFYAKPAPPSAKTVIVSCSS